MLSGPFGSLMGLDFLYPQASDRRVLLSGLPRAGKVPPSPSLQPAKPRFAVGRLLLFHFCLDHDLRLQKNQVALG